MDAATKKEKRNPTNDLYAALRNGRGPMQSEYPHELALKVKRIASACRTSALKREFIQSGLAFVFDYANLSCLEKLDDKKRQRQNRFPELILLNRIAKVCAGDIGLQKTFIGGAARAVAAAGIEFYPLSKRLLEQANAFAADNVELKEIFVTHFGEILRDLTIMEATTKKSGIDRSLMLSVEVACRVMAHSKGDGALENAAEKKVRPVIAAAKMRANRQERIAEEVVDQAPLINFYNSDLRVLRPVSLWTEAACHLVVNGNTTPLKKLAAQARRSLAQFMVGQLSPVNLAS